MAEIWFLTHADVVQDPAVPVPDWPLSSVGRRRHMALNGRLSGAGITSVYCSAEQKARDGAAIHAEALGLTPQIVAALGENDRSATGYLPPEQFQTHVDRFFSEPDISADGWETARAAQRRIAAAVAAISNDGPPGNIAIVAHGGVGALLHAHLAGAGISRRFEQPGKDGGNLLRIDRDSCHLLSGWERF